MTRMESLVQMAMAVEARSSCTRNRVGALIVSGARPIMTGYNGAPAGMLHCDHDCTCGKEIQFEHHHRKECASSLPCKIAVHAEANAIAYAAREGLRVEGAGMVVTLSPCLPCAQLIISAGIVSVIYVRAYRDPAGITLLTKANVSVRKYMG